MSRLKMPQRKEALEKLVQDITDFATKLHDLLGNRQTLSSDISKELERYTKQLPINGKVPGKHARTLDALGTDLWNAAASLINDVQRDPRPKATDPALQGVHIRVFAFLLLDTAQATQASTKKGDELQIRTITIALRAARLALDKNELALAMTVLERCGERIPDEHEEDELFHMARGPSEHRQTFRSIIKDLTSEFYLLRLLHAWKSSRLDLAEHYYARVVLTDASHNSHLEIKVADLFYELARSFSKLDKQDDAVKWFERAWGVSDQVSPENLCQEGAELFMSIGVSFATVLLSLQQVAHRKRAWEITTRLEQTHGLSSRLTIPILKFQILATEHRVDPDQMTNTLLQIVNFAVLTEDNFNMIMNTLRKASAQSSPAALHALRTLICNRLLPESGDHSATGIASLVWLEKASVAYILFHTKAPDFEPHAAQDDLQKLFDTLFNAFRSPFSPKATHAGQTLIWKAIGQHNAAHVFGLCRLLTHALFENAGHINKARIGRKLMSIAIDERDVAGAREAFFQMSETARNDASTRFLAFKLALLSKDDELAMESLQGIVKTASKDPTYLFACVIESQQHGMDHFTLATLQAVLSQRPSGVQMPALLRCTARLAVSRINDQNHSNNDTVQEVVKIFETASQHIDDLCQLAKAHWASEVQWWCKNSYNFALRHCRHIPPEYTLRILDVCITFIDACPTDVGQRETKQRKLLCAFLSTTALIVMGRSGEVGSEHTTQCFAHAQEQIMKFKSLQPDIASHDLEQETAARTFVMLKFDLECILHLQQWDRLTGVLQECLEVRPVERWDALADLIIIMHEHLDASSEDPHYATMVQVLQRMINDTWKKQKEIAKVARWVRFTFMLCLTHMQGNFSLRLLQQAATMAENGYRGKQDVYPGSELQWLATTAFNRAVDFLVEENKEEEARQWMDGALALAKWSQDNGSLHAVLTSKKEEAEQHVRDRTLQG